MPQRTAEHGWRSPRASGDLRSGRRRGQESRAECAETRAERLVGVRLWTGDTTSFAGTVVELDLVESALDLALASSRALA
jgi:hypothetical protein